MSSKRFLSALNVAGDKRIFSLALMAWFSSLFLSFILLVTVYVVDSNKDPLVIMNPQDN